MPAKDLLVKVIYGLSQTKLQHNFFDVLLNWLKGGEFNKMFAKSS